MDERGTYEDRRMEAREDRATGTREMPEGPGDETAALRAQVESLQGEVESLRRDVDDKQDKLLRALADADNTRRRARIDREDYVRYATESLVRDLVPILDNLDRALDAARAAGDAPGVVDGVDLIRREFLRVLERAGVTRYSALGQPFDPTRHEAVSRIVSVSATPDTVVAETAPGYSLSGRVLRPAMVVVAAAPDEDAA